MPTIDQKFVTRLDDFTRSLEGIVEILKEDIKNRNVDNVNEMLANMSNDITKIVTNLEVVITSVQKIESNTDKILEEVKAFRKAKETGAFETISETDNKKKIIDAVKTIVIIAAGVLAIGLAFKLISPVSFLSVIAIGLSIVFIAGAFVLVSALTDEMTPGDAFRVSSIMVIMSLGLVVASIALSLVATLSFAQMASIFFVAAAIGTSMFLITQALDKSKMEKKHLAQFLLLPIIVPALAIGLVVASLILSKIHTLSLMQMISSVFVAVTIGVLVYLMKPLIEKLEGFTLGQVLNAGILVAALASGLVVASWILTKMSFFTFRESLMLITTSLAIGLAVLFLTPAVLILKSIDKKDMFAAGVNIVIAAGAIAASSLLLSLGKYDNYPDWKWSIGVGLSMLAFGGVMGIFAGGFSMAYGDSSFDIPPLEPKQLLTGFLAILGVATAVMLTSIILNLGLYDNYPSLGWAMGAGLSLIAFGGSMMLLGVILSLSGGSASAALVAGALATLGVAATIVAVSWILGVGEYKDYPTLSWSLGVGFSLLAFGGAMVLMGFALPLLMLGALSMGVIASTIAWVSNIIAKGDYSGGINEEWAKALKISMNSFSDLMISTALIPNKVLLWGAESMMIIAQTIVGVSSKIAEGNYTGGPTSDWALATGALLVSFSFVSLFVWATLPFLLIGIGAVMAVAYSIVTVSNILSQGNYTGGPTKDWAEGVSLSIKAFAEGIAAMQETDSFFSFFGEDQGKKITDIAYAMIMANQILDSVDWNGNYPSDSWSKGVGGAIMAFADALAKLDKADIDGTDFLFDVMWLSLGIIAAAEILSEYDWNNATNYPKENWSVGVGNAIKAFAEPIAKLAEFDITGSDISRGIKKLSRGIVDAAEIIGEYDWSKASNYPKSDWVDGVGQAIGTFVKYLVEIEKNDIGRGDIKNLNRVVDSMVFTATKISIGGAFGIWDNYPSSEWSDGVGKAIDTFTTSIKKLTDVEDNFDLLSDFANSMLWFAVKLSILDKFKSLFAVGGTLDLFGTSMKKLVDSLPSENSVGGIKSLAESLNNISSLGISSSLSIYMLSRAVSDLGESLSDLDTESIEKLSKFSNGILVLSLIDDKKLQDTLTLLEGKRNDIKSILSDNARVEKTNPSATTTTSVVQTPKPLVEKETSSNREKFYEELLNYVRSLDSNVKTIAEKEPENDPAPSPANNVNEKTKPK